MLSCSVATAMTLTGGKDVSETAKFVGLIDNFLDLLNVRNFSAGARAARMPFQQPYHSTNDFRLAIMY